MKFVGLFALVVLIQTVHHHYRAVFVENSGPTTVVESDFEHENFVSTSTVTQHDDDSSGMVADELYDQLDTSETISNRERGQEEILSENLSRQDEATSENLSKGDVATSENLPKQDEAASENLTKQDEVTSENLSKQDEATSENLTKEDVEASENLTKQDEATSENLTKQDETKSENLLKQDEATCENLTKQDEATSENLSKRDVATSENLPKQDEMASENLSTENSTKSDVLFESTKIYHKHRNEIFPRICMDGMNVTVVDFVGNFVNSYTNLHRALSESAKRESTASSILFKIIDSLASATGSTSSVLNSLSTDLSNVFNSIVEVISDLNIQTFATELPGTIMELDKSLTKIIKIVNVAEKSVVVKKVNVETALIAKSVQEIVKTLNVMAEATTKAIGSVSSEVQEAVVSMTFVLGTILVIVQSINASIACVLSSSFQLYAATLDQFLAYTDSTLKSINGVIKPIDNLEPEEKSVAIGVISMTLAYLAIEVNPMLNSMLQSSDESDFSKSLEDLLHRLSELVGGISGSVSESVELMTLSLSLASASPFTKLAKVADQINLVFKGLSRVTGTDTLVLTILKSSLRSIFRTISSAVNHLQSAIGAEATDSLKNFIAKGIASLSTLISLVNGSIQESVSIQVIVKDIATSIQYILSSFDSIASTIADTVNDANRDVVEAILCMPLIFSAVLYAAQWLLSVAVSIFDSIVGSVTQSLLTLTILNSQTFHLLSKMSSTICSTQSDSIVDIFQSTEPLIVDLGHLISSSYASLSGSVPKIVFNIDKMLSGAVPQNVKPATNLLHNTKGTVPEILNTLTGNLMSLSPVLSSAVFSLKNSLKFCASSKSASLKLISNFLMLVLNQVTKVTASASDILPRISDELNGVFIHLASALSKFSILGDVSVSLNVSASNIQNALHMLIETINDCSTDLSILVDPVRNVAKTTQILISTFNAIFHAISEANKNIAKKLSETITNLPYIVSIIIVVVQYTVGAAIAKLLVTFGSLPILLQQLALALSIILQRIASIVANVTSVQNESNVDYSNIINKIVAPVSDFHGLTTTSFSEISLVLANINVSLDVPN